MTSTNNMNYKPTLIKLFHLLVNADGNVNEREIVAGKNMIKAEGIAEADFERMIESVKKRTTGVVYSECVEELQRFSHDIQIHCIAWLCVIANADGFMDKMEWQFIYKLYHAELHLHLDVIMKKQKELLGIREKPGIIAVL